MAKEKGEIKSGCGGRNNKSSAFEEKSKGQCGKKEETKKRSCADARQSDETQQKGDEKCICRSSISSSSFKKKEEGKCTSEKSSKGKKRKCDSSQEAFKKGLKGKEKGEECNNSYSEFLKERDNNKTSPCSERSFAGDQFQDSYKNFSAAKNKVESCTESVEKNVESPCQKLNEKFDSSETDITQDCVSAYDKLTSKTTGHDCKELPLKYVKHDLCSDNNSEKEILDSCCKKADELSNKKHPCPPVAEAGVTKVPKVTCPRMTSEQSISSFFPLDARNKELNACVDKYMNVDPSQVITKCSQFANINVDKSKECAEVDKKIEKDCARPQHRRSSIPSTLRQSRGRQMLSRWGPSAAVYLAATTAALFWVTEWKEPLQVVKDSVEGALHPSSSD